MKFFFVGDFTSDTGPGVANRMLRKGLLREENAMYSDCRSKLGRVLEIVQKTLRCDCVCFCSPSKANLIGIRIAKLFNRKMFYLMHGYLTYEYEINARPFKDFVFRKIQRFERHIFKNVDGILCVSKKFMEFMKKAEPEFAHKFDFNFNGLDLAEIEGIAQNLPASKDEKQIVSLGGGMRRKGNLTICKAIEKLNQERKMGLKYVVIGLPYTDKKEITAYDFVDYYDELSHDQVLDVLLNSFLYVQNSVFETFGLAVIEALMCGCNLLISNNIGALDTLGTLDSGDVITSTTDVDEIADKIQKIMVDGNVTRLQQGLKRDVVDYRYSASLLLEKIRRYVGGSCG